MIDHFNIEETFFLDSEFFTFLSSLDLRCFNLNDVFYITI